MIRLLIAHHVCLDKAISGTGSVVLCEDVLYRIFEVVAEHTSRFPDWAAAALVCRTWTRPAQVAMYNTFTFYMSKFSNPRWDGFILSMETYTHLRPFLRHLTLWSFSDTVEERTKWMKLLPEHGLQTFQYSWCQHRPLPSVLDIPCVRTVTQLNLRGHMTTKMMKACCECRFLQTLCITFYDPLLDDSEVELTPPSSLKHLVAIMLYANIPSAYSLIVACAPQLSTFALHAPLSSMQRHRASLAHTLLTRTSLLTEFTLIDLSPSNLVLEPAQPLTDELVLRNPSLERVHCPEGTYSEQFFQRLPATLRVLELALGRAPYSYEPALLQYILRVGEEGLGLRRLCLRFWSVNEEPWKNIAEACEKSGVEFCVDQYRETLDKARGREWSA